MSERAFLDAHMRAAYARSRNVGALLVRAGGVYGYASDEFVGAAVDVVLAGQTEQALASWGYLSTVVDMADPLGRTLDVEAPLDLMIGAATHDGTPLETVYRRPGALEKTLSFAGVDPKEIESRIASEVELMADADLAVAGRKAEQVYGAVDKRVVGWRRVPNVDACKWCRYIATQRYKTQELAPAHRGCHCGTEPIIGKTDPGRVVDRDELAKIKKEGVPKKGDFRLTEAAKANKKLDALELPEIVESPALRGLPTGSRSALSSVSPEVVTVAERYGISGDEVLAARGRAADVKKAIRDEAARVQLRAFERLDDFDARSIARPPRNRSGLGEWDWLDGLDERERARLSRQFYSDTGVGPDVVAQQIRNRGLLSADASTDDAMELWLEASREYEAAGAIRRGKLPSTRAYSNQIDVDRLLPSISDEGFSVEKILGSSDDLDIAGHIASVEKNALVDEAKDYLGKALDAREGPSPYRMSYQAWEEEVRSLEYGLREFPSEMPRNAKARLAELVPEFIDEPGLDYEDLFARIVDTAHKATEEVPDYVRIPWSE